MSVEELKAAAEKMLRLHYCSLAPTEAQAKFLFHFGREAFFGGAAGGGKSVAFQLPAMLLAGGGLVISPLRALMRDQMEDLRYRHGINSIAVTPSDCR